MSSMQCVDGYPVIKITVNESRRSTVLENLDSRRAFYDRCKCSNRMNPFWSNRLVFADIKEQKMDSRIPSY